MPPELTHAQLDKAVAQLGRDIARSGDQISAHAREISEEAVDTAAVGNTIGAMDVDTATVSETAELAKILEGLEAGARAYAAAGDFAVRRAKAAQQQNHTSHTGIGQAAGRSPVGRQVFQVHRDWLSQE